LNTLIEEREAGSPKIFQVPNIKKKIIVPEPLSFNKTKKQFFKNKTKPYISLIHEKDSETIVESYQNILKNLRADSNL
jgi:hypothetical protein